MTNKKTTVIFEEDRLQIEVTSGELTSRVTQTKDKIKIHVPVGGKIKLNPSKEEE